MPCKQQRYDILCLSWEFKKKVKGIYFDFPIDSGLTLTGRKKKKKRGLLSLLQSRFIAAWLTERNLKICSIILATTDIKLRKQTEQEMWQKTIS